MSFRSSRRPLPARRRRMSPLPSGAGRPSPRSWTGSAPALAEARSSADRLDGQLHAAGDPAVLRASARGPGCRKERLETEYSALRLAMEALEGANTALQNRFSPALGRRAAEIFFPTDRQPLCRCGAGPELPPLGRACGRPGVPGCRLLSAGALDQLYLAVRLAICELVLPPEKQVPIVLDDALANFDDSRCAAALQFLKEAAGNRQILLFTCHSREGEFFAGDREVFVQRLTDAAVEV